MLGIAVPPLLAYGVIGIGFSMILWGVWPLIKRMFVNLRRVRIRVPFYYQQTEETTDLVDQASLNHQSEALREIGSEIYDNIIACITCYNSAIRYKQRYVPRIRDTAFENAVNRLSSEHRIKVFEIYGWFRHINEELPRSAYLIVNEHLDRVKERYDEMRIISVNDSLRAIDNHEWNEYQRSIQQTIAAAGSGYL